MKFTLLGQVQCGYCEATQTISVEVLASGHVAYPDRYDLEEPWVGVEYSSHYGMGESICCGKLKCMQELRQEIETSAYRPWEVLKRFPLIPSK